MVGEGIFKIKLNMKKYFFILILLFSFTRVSASGLMVDFVIKGENE